MAQLGNFAQIGVRSFSLNINMCMSVLVHMCMCMIESCEIIASVGQKETNTSNIIWFMYVFIYISDFSCLTEAVTKIVMSRVFFVYLKTNNQPVTWILKQNFLYINILILGDGVGKTLQ